jgi:hypothetical protein
MGDDCGTSPTVWTTFLVALKEVSLSNLNRRHKVGLFLVVVATGLSLFFEASAKQTTGIALLGLAATWLLGSLSVRVLWLFSSLLSCAVGVALIVVPVLKDWNSLQVSAQNYDKAIADLRQAIAKPRYTIEPPGWAPVDNALAKNHGVSSSSPTPNRPQEFTDVRPLPGVADYDRNAKGWIGSDWLTENASGKIQWQNQTRKVQSEKPAPKQRWDEFGKPINTPAAPSQGDWQVAHEKPAKPLQGQYTLADIDTFVEVPATAQSWERADFISGRHVIGQEQQLPGSLPADYISTLVTTLYFSADVDKEEILSAFQSQLLEPRPRFSARASVISNRLTSLIGLVLLTAGLLNLGWFIRSVLRAKRGHGPQMA